MGRVDDLGRIGIPKEIRRTLSISKELYAEKKILRRCAPQNDKGTSQQKPRTGSCRCGDVS